MNTNPPLALEPVAPTEIWYDPEDDEYINGDIYEPDMVMQANGCVRYIRADISTLRAPAVEDALVLLREIGNAAMSGCESSGERMEFREKLKTLEAYLQPAKPADPIAEASKRVDEYKVDLSKYPELARTADAGS